MGVTLLFSACVCVSVELLEELEAGRDVCAHGVGVAAQSSDHLLQNPLETACYLELGAWSLARNIFHAC